MPDNCASFGPPTN